MSEAQSPKKEVGAIIYKDHGVHEADLALASVKTMGYWALRAQVESTNPKMSETFKAACAAELKERGEARAAKTKTEDITLD